MYGNGQWDQWLSPPLGKMSSPDAAAAAAADDDDDDDDSPYGRKSLYLIRFHPACRSMQRGQQTSNPSPVWGKELVDSK